MAGAWSHRREARGAAVGLRGDWRLHVRRDVYDIIRSLKPSGRGELEITDVNNAYIEREEMTWEELDGWWTDAGTFESLLRASKLVAETGANRMEFVAEEVAANAPPARRRVQVSSPRTVGCRARVGLRAFRRWFDEDVVSRRWLTSRRLVAAHARTAGC